MCVDMNHLKVYSPAYRHSLTMRYEAPFVIHAFIIIIEITIYFSKNDNDFNIIFFLILYAVCYIMLKWIIKDNF